MIILVLNCGSSSIKYQVLDMKNDEIYDLLAKGLVERIGMEQGHLVHKPAGKAPYEIEKPIANHTVGVKAVLEALVDPEHGVLKAFSDIDAVGHRVLHGGAEFFCSMKVNDAVEAQIEKCCDLGPLHNPANLRGIRAVKEVLPEVPQVVVFDTAFHQTMPDYAYMYAIPYEYYDKYHIRKYGFHGTSHRYVSAKGAKFAGLDINDSKIVTCHLGNGSSIAAVRNGKCVDTSMGVTPLDGLIMGTRCGTMDPAVVTYLEQKEGFSAAEMDTLMNKKSGLLGVGGVSSDLRDNLAASAEGNERATLAIKMLIYDVQKYVGSYAAAMNGVDLIIFTGGIGENNARIRHDICENLTYLGVRFDNEANANRADEMLISLPDSPVKVAVIATNEELVIAQDTRHIVLGLDK